MSSCLSQVAYDHLQQLLLADRLPCGTKVSELAVARDLGISRTPVREAIRRLQVEGLLYQIPSSGTYVAEPDRKQIVDAHETRMALELLLTRRAVPRLGQAGRAELHRLVEQMRHVARRLRLESRSLARAKACAELFDLEEQFQAALLAPADNQVAAKIVRDTGLRNRVVLQRTAALSLADAARSVLAYYRIKQAASVGDGEQAARLLETHLAIRLNAALDRLDLRRTHAISSYPPR